MSLQVWLPLTGHNVNQGINGGSITWTTTPTYINNGKLGQAMATGGAKMPASMTAQILNNTAVTIACWLYVNADAGDSTNRAMVFGNDPMSSAGGRQFSIFRYPHADDIHLSWQSYNNGTYSSILGSVDSGVLTAHAWNHICVTYQNPNVTLYVNGAVVHKYTATMAASSFNFDTNLIYNSSSHYINDFRIYNHCLSVKEVRELSKALVLHYKLDDPYVEGTTNYLTAAGSCANWRDYTASTWATSIDSTCAIGNYVITYSAYIKNNTNVSLRVRCSPLYVAGSYGTVYGNWIAPGGEGWSSLTCDISDSATYTGSFYPYVATSIAGTIPDMPNFQVLHAQAERNDHRTAWTLGGTTRAADTTVYDCSGYRKNGTVLNSISINAATGRYGASVIFNGTNAKIRLPAINFSGMANSYTFAWWQYNKGSGNMPWGFSDGNRLNLYHTSPLCWNTGDGSSNQFKDGSTTVPYSAVQNAWHHMAVTGDGTYAKLYIDGVYRGTATTYKAITGTQIYLSGWDTSTSYTFNGSKESDFRIYATALSAADVAELYHTEVAVDHNGSTLAREVVEL